MKRAAGAVAALLAIGGARWVAGDAWARGFPLDDAWIHMVYGLALRTEGSLAYNDGVPATGTTSPLWAIVTALAHVLAGAAGPSMRAVAIVKAIGIALHAASAWFAADVAWRLSPRAARAATAWIAGGLVALAPIGLFAAVSGMEVGLGSALLLGACSAALRGRTRAAGLLLGLAAVARPEAVMVAPCVAVAVAARRGARRALELAALAALPYALVVLRTLRVSGHPLPATFYGKMRAPSLDRLDVRARFVLDDMFGELEPYGRTVFVALLLVALAFGILAARRRFAPVSARRVFTGAMAGACLGWTLALTITIGANVPRWFYFQRYYAPILPLGMVSAVVALGWLHAGARRARPVLRAAVVVLPALLLAVPAAARLPDERARYLADVAAIDDVQVALGRRIGETPGAVVVWSQDAGAPRYFGRKLVVDLFRLNTPELLTTPDLPDALAPTFLLVPAAIWRIDGGVHTIATAAPRYAKERSSRQSLLGCTAGAAVSASFQGVRVASSHCANGPQLTP